MKCDLCSNISYVDFYPHIVKCKECGHIYANLDVSEEELKNIYNTDYFHGEEYSDYLDEKDIIQKNFTRLLNILSKYIDPVKHKNLLEVGSAYGFFLEKAKKNFQKIKGIEIAEEPARYARDILGLDVKNIDLLNWDFDESVFDVVCMWDVMEHLYSPNRYLNKISKNIKNDGILAFTTVDIGSLVAKTRKQNWRQIHPPSHAHYFYRETIERLLEENGFEIIKFTHFGRHRSLGMIAYIIFVQRLRIPFVYTLLKFINFTKIITYLNLFDEMLVIARKIDTEKNLEKNIIIHADDFGLSVDSSDAIIECLNSSLTRTSIMSNGAAFEYAIDKYLSLDNIENKNLGIHLNLSEGSCVTKNKKLDLISNNKGKFNLSFFTLITRYLLLGKKRRKIFIDQIRTEIVSQLKKVRGKLPYDYELHLDSHHYVHSIPFIIDIIIDLKDDHNISSMRLPNEMFSFSFNWHNIKNLFSVNIIKFFVLKFLSISLKKKLDKNNIKYNDYFIGILFSGKNTVDNILKSLKSFKNKNSSSLEILFHPGSISKTELSDWNITGRSQNFYRSQNRQIEKEILLDERFKRKVNLLNQVR